MSCHRIASASLLAIALALSAIAPASATNNVTIRDEKTNTICPNLSADYQSGGCLVHFSGEIELQGWAFVWFHEDSCLAEFEMRVGGVSQISVTDFDQYIPSSGRCDAAGKDITCNMPWKGSLEMSSNGTFENDFHTGIDVCINAPELDVCGSKLEFDITENGWSENHWITFVNTNLGSVCRLNGTLNMETANSAHAAMHMYW